METELTESQNRLRKRQDLIDQGENPYVSRYARSHDIDTVLTTYSGLEHGDESTHSVSLQLAGRLIAQRSHGKAIFGNISDFSGSIQFYTNINTLGDTFFQSLNNLDIGDIIGITGYPFVTRRGELSIFIQSFILLTKALLPLPEKFHGLQNKETRYRQRYLDLISNKDVKHTFVQRSRIIRSIRNFLEELDFLEVETPVLHSIYGGAHAKPFKTFHNTLQQSLYLRIALELHLKRLIVGGFEKVYEIGRVFRNEGISYKHNPEYTLMELYQAYTDYHDIMELTENIVAHCVNDLHGQYTLSFNGIDLDCKPPFRRVTLDDAMKEYAGISIHEDEAVLFDKARSMGLDPAIQPIRGELINFIYDKAVEPKLIQPTFVMDYPWETSPLAKRKSDNPQLVERFELIVNGMELANAFTELNDPVDQETRFNHQQKAREAGWDEAQMMDQDFIEALKHGMPPTGGLGIGIDRLVMLLTDQTSIRDVLFFPHLKTESVEQGV